jgi:hypothetical protein
MRTHSWLDVWNLFLEVISHESIPVQIFSGLAVALIGVMALEGLRASFFPKRIADGVALRRPAPLPPSDKPMAFTETPTMMEPALEYITPSVPSSPEYVARPVLAAVNTGNLRRRSSPQPLRISRKPS